MRGFFIICTMFLLFSAGARADVFVYHNPDYDFSVTFPDDWRQMNVTGTERLRIRPMHGEDSAECAMRALADGRLTIYPEKYLQTANALILDDSFWKTEVLPDHLNYKVMSFYAPAGLGPAFATSLQWVWREVIAGNPVPQPSEFNPGGLSPMMGAAAVPTATDTKVMQALSTAAIYGENRYRFTCQAESESFAKWQPVFSDIFASIELQEKYNLWPTGYYRNFLK